MIFNLPPVKADNEMLAEVLTFLENNNYNVHETETDVTLHHHTTNLKLRLRKNTSDFHVFAEIFIKYDYKFLIENYEKKFGKQSPNFIIDIGANIGCATLYFKELYPNATVLAVEAEKNNFLALKHNVELNQSENTHLYHNAFWINEDVLMVEESFRDGRDWAFATRPVAEKSSQSVAGITIQKMLENYQNKMIDILKIDIEGGEKWILEDTQTMKFIRKNTNSLLIEIHAEVITMEKALEILKNVGFECVTNNTLIFAY